MYGNFSDLKHTLPYKSTFFGTLFFARPPLRRKKARHALRPAKNVYLCAAMSMNREIIRLAIPNTVSNITVPLMGIVSTAIAGHWGIDTAATIGALAIGVQIFNFIYWNTSFIRMGTSGLTAQAFGRGDMGECTNMLVRAVCVALCMGVIMLLIQYPVGELALWAMNGGEMTRDYFYARVWAIPAGILLFAFNGWYTGMQNAYIPMCTAITVNLIHMCCSLWFAFGLDLGIVGIAYASIIAQWTGVTLSIILLFSFYRQMLTEVDWKKVLDLTPLKEYFKINGDIIVRTFCIVMVYTFFTGVSANMEDKTILAVNTLLLQLFTLFSYMSDGFAYAAEALTGRFIGAKDLPRLKDSMKKCCLWGIALAVCFVGVYIVFWHDILELFVGDQADAGVVIETAGHYVGWVILIPIAGVVPFVMDGMMVGATETRVMRRSMMWSTGWYFASYFVLHFFIGNDALWFAFVSFMSVRGIIQFILTKHFRTLYKRAE